MSINQELKQENENLIYQFGILHLRMDALRVQAIEIEKAMTDVKLKLRENVEKQKAPEVQKPKLAPKEKSKTKNK